jgi:hypothetical protein
VANMTKPSVIAAYLVDMRNVGAHKSLRLTLHVPEEAALDAIAAFGWPTGVNPVSVALARLDPDTAVMPRKELTPDKKLVRRIGMLCGDPVFQKFMLEDGRARAADEEEVAAGVRAFCGVKSRNEIVAGSPARERWDRLDGRFKAWLIEPKVAAK